jgi:hypothetical protein
VESGGSNKGEMSPNYAGLVCVSMSGRIWKAGSKWENGSGEDRLSDVLRFQVTQMLFSASRESIIIILRDMQVLF